MELSQLYYQLLLSLILDEYKDEFINAKPGHCMKITGLALRELQPLCAAVRALPGDLQTYILSDEIKGDEYISANKLIEFRNDDSLPLLILIPSNSRTSTEDSYGNATFKNLFIEHLDNKLFENLKAEIPTNARATIMEIFDYLRIQGLRTIQYLQYLLYVKSLHWSDAAIGNGLAYLTMIPDEKITKEYAHIRQRLLYNLKCVDILGDFAHPVPDRIRELPLTPNSLQKEITAFLRTENSLKNKSEICQAILQSYPDLNFGNWKVPDFETIHNLHVFVDRITSKDMRVSEGDLTLTIPREKSSKLKIRISTKPSPKDFKDLKNFRIVLMAIDGWYPVTDVKKTKITENARNYREVTMDFSEAMFEEGSYFLRVFAEDENGGILNTQDDFISEEWTERWKAEQKQNPELTRDQFSEANRIKYTSDSEDFYLHFGEVEEGGETFFQRKNKLDNVLQAYFRFRVEQLRTDEELSLPIPIEDSAVWLKGGQTGLVGTFHVKYSSTHNYQINLSNKLHRLQACFLEHADVLGSIDATLSSNPMDSSFQSLRYNASNSSGILPLSLLNARKDLFTVIAQSAPDNTGVFETFDAFNHIELIRNYVSEYEQWTKQLKMEIETDSIQSDDLQKLLVELQNLEVISIKTEMPDGQIIYLKLISPLHPLRLAWFVNLFDLYTNWEDETRIYPQYRTVWYKNLENLFLGDLIPDAALPVMADMAMSEYFQYVGELAFGWGLYSKPLQKNNDAFSSVSRQIKIYLSSLLNIANEYRIDTDVNQALVGRHITNYLSQHPYTDKLIINLFNAGDAFVFADAMVDIERLNGYKSLKYEIRLFADDKIIIPGEAFRSLINPESNISEDAEAFSQASGNRLFPKLRFSINSIADFIQNPKEYFAHISFLISPFPVKTALTRPDDRKQSFFFNGLISRNVISVTQKSNAIIWNKYLSENPVPNSVNEFCNTGISLFANMQSFVANSLSTNREQSVPATRLELNESDKVLLSFIHDISDWVVTFDKNMGPEVYDLPGNEGEIPFLLDYVPGQEVSGISSYLTTRPTSEIVGLLGPHFAEFGIDLRSDAAKLKIMLEDIRSISSSLILQFNSTSNKAFEVLGTAFTKRVLEKKNILEDAFLIPIDLHRELFENLPTEIKDRADTLLVKINPANKDICFTVIEIKCRTSLNESERMDLISKMESQIENTIQALRYHFDTTYSLSNDRLDRELKTLQLKSLLEFYVNRASRYNQLAPIVQEGYISLLDNLNYGYTLSFKRLGFIFDFSAPQRHKKESYANDSTYITFGRNMIEEILDPDSDLNTRRLEHIAEDSQIISFFGESSVEAFNRIVKKDSPVVKLEIPIDKPADNVEEPLAEQKQLEPESMPQEPVIPIDIVEPPVEVIPLKPSVEDTSDYELPDYDIIVGKSSTSPQYGILGKVVASKKPVALDLSETNTISLFGVQGGGKSYTIGTITEMVLKQFSRINELPAPLAGVIFHYSESMDYEPEFTSMIYPNDKQDELQKLKDEFGANPGSLSDVVILTPQAKVNERREQYPSIDVFPISFNSNELNVQDWMFLLGAIGNDSTYIRQLKAIMRNIRDNISLQALRTNVANSILLSNTQKTLAEQRIQFASEYIEDNSSIRDLLRPGRLIIVDLRDEFIEKDEALGLFVVMLNIFSGIKTYESKPFNKFIVFDEAHKYMDNKDLTSSIVTAIREMRHKGVSIMIASQDPLSLPNEIIELSSMVLLHKFNSPQWVKHIQKSITQMASLTPSDLSSLVPGEGYLWASKSTDKSLMNRPVKIFTRPRVTKHGGETLKAI
ncbi:MAG: ATP-binding protein [Prolixibacteraceae bacterium]|nr:ATP-binding protein [Prolixibacteraceae bacterium]